MKRQGDILFVRADDTRVGREKDDNVIAQGETTGHTHRVEGGQLHYLPQRQGESVLAVVAPNGAAVVHEEHDTVTLEPGVWLIVNQREYSAPGETTTVYD